MLIKFTNQTFLEKPVGSKLVGLKRESRRPVSIELDYFDFEKLLKASDIQRYLVHLWTALAPDKRVVTSEHFNGQV